MKLTGIRLLTVCLLLVPTMACGQQPTPQPQGTPNTQILSPVTNELTLKVTFPEAELIWTALRKLPVEQVEQLMAKIRQQVAEQTAPKKEPDK